MVDKRVVAAIMIAAAATTLIFYTKSLEAYNSMDEAMIEFYSNYEPPEPPKETERHADFPDDSEFHKAMEPYRTHFRIYLFLAWGSGVTAICCLLFAAKDFMLETVKRLSRSS